MFLDFKFKLKLFIICLNQKKNTTNIKELKMFVKSVEKEKIYKRNLLKKLKHKNQIETQINEIGKSKNPSKRKLKSKESRSIGKR